MKYRILMTITACAAALLGVAEAASPKPNLLFVLTDQWWRQALGFMSEDPVLTPNLDRFAAGAAVFTHAVATSMPQNIDGTSLLPFLKGETEHGPRDYLVSSAIHSSRWSYSYEGEGENNKKDASDCPLYAFSIQGDRLLMHIAAIKPGLYNALPDGMPDRTLLFDLKSDPQQLTDLHTQHPEQVSVMNRQIHEWLEMCHEPLTSQQQDYNFMLKETSK